MLNIGKWLNLTKAVIQTRKSSFPAWVHLWVTERCNLDCDYCYVSDNNTDDPSTEELKERISHAADLGSVLIAFMGGEPILRKDLPELIAFTDQLGLGTYLTSNGSLLTAEKLEELVNSSLDFLEISLDGYSSSCSRKTLDNNPELIDRLEQSGLNYKLHQVLTPETSAEVPKLLRLARDRRIPISFGLVQQQDYEQKEELVDTLNLLYKNRTLFSPITNPRQYFKDAIDFLQGKKVDWDCNLGKYCIQISTSGQVYQCSVLGSVLDIDFLDIDQNYFKQRKHLEDGFLEQCQPNCLSACAYLTSSIRKNPLELSRYALLSLLEV